MVDSRGLACIPAAIGLGRSETIVWGARAGAWRVEVGQLPEQAFVRISRSCLVNVERIREIRFRPHGNCLVGLNDGTELTGIRNFRDSLERVLGRSK